MNIKEVFKRQIDTRDEDSVHPMSRDETPLVFAMVKSEKGSLLLTRILDDDLEEFDKNHTLIKPGLAHFPVFEKKA